MKGRTGKMIDWSAVPLGMESDAHIARCLGVTRPTVRRERVRRGIAPVTPRRCGTEEEVPCRICTHVSHATHADVLAYAQTPSEVVRRIVTNALETRWDSETRSKLFAGLTVGPKPLRDPMFGAAERSKHVHSSTLCRHGDHNLTHEGQLGCWRYLPSGDRKRGKCVLCCRDRDQKRKVRK
jgi:hypothetical protein